MPKDGPFPVLKPQELREMMQTYLSVDVEVRDFEKPSPEFVQRVYESVIAVLVGPHQFEYGSLHTAEYPELFAEAAPKLAAFAKLQRILHKLMIRDFCFEDLLRPEGARFMTQMSGLMNFFRFRGERLAVLQQCDQNQTTIAEERRLLDEATRKKKVELMTMKERHEAERLEAEGMEPERQNQRQWCHQLTRSHDQLFSQRNELRTATNKLKDDLATASFEYNSRIQERENLEDQIVQSPGRIRSRIEEVNRKLIDTRGVTSEMLSKDTQLAEEIGVIQELGKRMEEHLELLKQIESVKSVKTDASKQNKGQLAAFENSRMGYKKIAEEIAALGQKYDAVTTELQTVERTAKTMQTEVDEALKRKLDETRQEEQRNTEIQSTVVSAGERKVAELQRLTETMAERHRREVAMVMQKYEMLERQFRDWCIKAHAQSTNEQG